MSALKIVGECRRKVGGSEALYPLLLVIAPVVVFVLVVAKLELSGLKTIWVGLAAVGGTY
jgi:hypothetical protein